MKVVTIGNSDEDADWLKRLAGGKYREEDMAASEDALKKHRKGIVKALKSYITRRRGENNSS